jgi:hypothetical protein
MIHGWTKERIEFLSFINNNSVSSSWFNPKEYCMILIIPLMLYDFRIIEIVVSQQLQADE